MPSGVVTVMSTVPVPGGEVAVIDVAESAVTVAGMPPKSTADALARSEPVMTTLVPPAGVPDLGSTPVTVGAGLMVVLVGIPILILAFALIRAFVAGERLLLRKLLDAVVPDPAPVRRPAALVSRMMSYLGDAQLWKGLVYLLMHFAFGVVSFSLVMALIPASVALLMAPLTYTLVPYNVMMTRIDTFDQAVLCCSAGAIMGLLSLHLLNLWAALWKRVGVALLT